MTLVERKAMETIPEINELQKVEIKPDDVIVVTLRSRVPDEKLRRIKEHLMTVFPGNKIVVFGESIQFAVYEKSQEPSASQGGGFTSSPQIGSFNSNPSDQYR